METVPSKSRIRETFASTLLAACVVVVLLATMWPTPLDKDYSASIVKFLDVLHRNGVPAWFGYGKLEFSANILMFLPIGFLVALVLPARVWWISVILCPLLSIGIELTQATFLSARFATFYDVLANSTGAIVGIVLALVLRSLVYERDQKLIARVLWENNVSQPLK